jgi:hypothetical protein
MKHSEWLKSKEKWENIKKRINKKIDTGTKGSCSFCEEYMWIDCDCEECPLFQKEICAQDGDKYPNVLFWQLQTILSRPYKKIAWTKSARLANKIYEAILEEEPRGDE